MNLALVSQVNLASRYCLTTAWRSKYAASQSTLSTRLVAPQDHSSLLFAHALQSASGHDRVHQGPTGRAVGLTQGVGSYSMQEPQSLYRQQAAKHTTAGGPLCLGLCCCHRVYLIGAEAIIFICFVSLVLLLLPCFVYECNDLLHANTAALAVDCVR